MHGLFDLLGVLLGLYTAWCLVTGSVVIKHRAWARTVHRSDGFPFWSSIVIYGVLSVLLVVYF